MKNKICKRYNYLAEKIAADIRKKEERIDQIAMKLKAAVAEFDTQQIAAFVPGYVRQIEELKAELKVLEEKMQMLVWMVDED